MLNTTPKWNLMVEYSFVDILSFILKFEGSSRRNFPLYFCYVLFCFIFSFFLKKICQDDSLFSCFMFIFHFYFSLYLPTFFLFFLSCFAQTKIFRLHDYRSRLLKKSCLIKVRVCVYHRSNCSAPCVERSTQRNWWLDVGTPNANQDNKKLRMKWSMTTTLLAALFMTFSPLPSAHQESEMPWKQPVSLKRSWHEQQGFNNHKDA